MWWGRRDVGQDTLQKSKGLLKVCLGYRSQLGDQLICQASEQNVQGVMK